MIEIKISKELRNRMWGDSSIYPIRQWCVDNFGPPEPNGTRWAWDTIRTFWFHDEQDAMLFQLRWS